MKIAKNWKKRLKSYSSISIMANILVALSVSSLSVLGVISSSISFPLLATLAVLFGVLGLVGRVVDQAIDDTTPPEVKEVTYNGNVLY